MSRGEYDESTSILAAYDIRHPRRLRKALFVSKDYARGGQKSVFECYLTATEKQELTHRIKAVMDDTEDRFLIVPLKSGAVSVLGKAIEPLDPGFYYVG